MTEPPVVPVTAREREVIGELAWDGPNNHEIATRLGYTHNTVRDVLKAVMKRTGHNTRAALAIDLLRGRIKLRVVDHIGNRGVE